MVGILFQAFFKEVEKISCVLDIRLPVAKGLEEGMGQDWV